MTQLWSRLSPASASTAPRHQPSGHQQCHASLRQQSAPALPAWHLDAGTPLARIAGLGMHSTCQTPSCFRAGQETLFRFRQLLAALAQASGATAKQPSLSSGPCGRPWQKPSDHLSRQVAPLVRSACPHIVVPKPTSLPSWQLLGQVPSQLGGPGLGSHQLGVPRSGWVRSRSPTVGLTKTCVGLRCCPSRTTWLDARLHPKAHLGI